MLQVQVVAGGQKNGKYLTWNCYAPGTGSAGGQKNGKYLTCDCCAPGTGCIRRIEERKISNLELLNSRDMLERDDRRMENI